MKITIDSLLPYLLPTPTWPDPVLRAETITDPTSFIACSTQSAELIRELYADIPPNIFAHIVQNLLITRNEQIDDNYTHFVHVFDIVSNSTSSALDELKQSTLFRLSQKEAKEKQRKLNWKIPMAKRLSKKLGSGWECKLDPSTYS